MKSEYKKFILGYGMPDVALCSEAMAIKILFKV